jgi:cell division protein FtsQ
MKLKSAIIGFVKWIALVTYILVALSFVGNRSNMVTCSSINIEIADSLNNSFVTKSDVLKTIQKHNSNLIGIPIRMINTYEIEKQIANIQAVKNVDAFTTSDGKLNIRVNQRTPMVRIINRNGQSYYIDLEGQTLPLSRNYTSHVLVINGNITEPFEIGPNIKVMNWADKEINEQSPLICQLYDFAKFLHNDRFWKAQISQVYVASQNNIELIPRVGPHVVILGSLTDYETKLAKLKLFYQKALPDEGWNKYKTINLKYRNQIVCTKR